MFDLLAFIIGFFLICLLGLIILVGVTFLYRIFNFKTSKVINNYQEQEDDKQIQDNINKDSEADMLMTSDDENQMLFPPEFDEDE